jgi:hypothetical protein
VVREDQEDGDAPDAVEGWRVRDHEPCESGMMKAATVLSSGAAELS